MKKKTVIGIDFGNNFSRVSYFQNGQGDTIIISSCVAFTDSERIIGDSAKSQAFRNPTNTIFNGKCFIGRHFYDPEIQSDLKYLPFTVTEKSGRLYIQIQNEGKTKDFTAEDICSMMITKLKESAEAHLREEVNEAVIAVPSYFNYFQRQLIREACRVAGLDVLNIINESTCAGITYCHNYKPKGNKNVLIFNLGGSGLNISIINIKDGHYKVEATAGDSHLGGEDINKLLVDYFAKEFKIQNRKDIFTNPKSLRRLISACEEVKKTLSSKSNASIKIDSFYDGIDFCSSITQEIFESLCSNLFQQYIKTIEKVLQDSNINKYSINEIILVGGSTRIPKIQSLISEFFNYREILIIPDDAIAYGAALEAAKCSGELQNDLSLSDISPYSYGIQIANNKKNTIIELIERQKPIPTVKSKVLNYEFDNKKPTLIKVFEGESSLTRNNKLLHEFELTSFLPSSKIELVFEVNTKYQLNIIAYDMANGGKIKAIEINNKFYKQNSEKYNLESYTYNIRNFIQQLSDATNETIEWLSQNQDEINNEYKGRKKDLEREIDSIITKIKNQKYIG